MDHPEKNFCCCLWLLLGDPKESVIMHKRRIRSSACTQPQTLPGFIGGKETKHAKKRTTMDKKLIASATFQKRERFLSPPGQTCRIADDSHTSD
jgi:cytochrome c biogenesis protein ResB